MGCGFLWQNQFSAVLSSFTQGIYTLTARFGMQGSSLQVYLLFYMYNVSALRLYWKTTGPCLCDVWSIVIELFKNTLLFGFHDH